ncbi:MAG: flagellar export protein FliJ [Nitrospirales bacterium]|nr:flagellar FliJ family protein [Nitrospirales bacterium]
MNWTTLLKFRKQVEDMAREAVVLTEWEKSQGRAKVDQLHREMDMIVGDLATLLHEGTDSLFTRERYRWMDVLQKQLEEQGQKIQALDEKLVGLRDKLKKSYQARRVVELVIAKKEREVFESLARQEQQLHDEITAHAYSMRKHEKIA